MARAQAPSEGIFTLSSPALDQTESDVLGLWIAHQGIPGEPLAFGGEPGPDVSAPTWRVDLPADVHLARAYLAQAEKRLDALPEALVGAETRLQAFVDSRQRVPSARLSFDSFPDSSVTPGPERELESFLQAVSLSRLQPSYGLGEGVAKGITDAAGRVRGLAGQLLLIAAYYARVETLVDGHLLGRTIVTWTGDLETIWSDAVGRAEATLHQRSLALALTSRIALLRTVLLAIRGALLLALLLGAPGASVVALPAAWQFIHQVLAENGPSKVKRS